MDIREGREAAGLSQDALGIRAKVRKYRLSLFEQGLLALEPDELERLWRVLHRAIEARSVEIEKAKQAVAEVIGQ